MECAALLQQYRGMLAQFWESCDKQLLGQRLLYIAVPAFVAVTAFGHITVGDCSASIRIVKTGNILAGRSSAELAPAVNTQVHVQDCSLGVKDAEHWANPNHIPFYLSALALGHCMRKSISLASVAHRLQGRISEGLQSTQQCQC